MSRFVNVFLDTGNNDGVASLSIDLSRQMTTKELCSRVCAQLHKGIETLASSSIVLVGRKKLRLDGKTKYVETEVGTLSDGDHPYKWLQRSTRENELKLIFRTRRRDAGESAAAERITSAPISSPRLYSMMRFITDLSAPKNFGRDILLECKHFGYLTVLPQVATTPKNEGMSVPAGDFECFLCTNEIWLFKPHDFGPRMLADGTDAVGFIPLDDSAHTSVVSVRSFSLHGSHNFRVSFAAASNRDMLTWIEGIENRSMLMSDNDLMSEAEAKINFEELRRSAVDVAFVEQLDGLEGTLRCTHMRRCFKTFIAETELDGGKQSALQCLLFWIEVERYRCCTSQWQPGSGFPEAYAAWIQGRYVSAGLLGIDVGDTDLDTDLVGAFDRAQHVVFRHLEGTAYQHFRRQPRYQTNRLVTLVATIPTLRVTNFLWFCDVYGRAAGAAVAFATEPPPTTGTEPWEFNLPDFVANARGKNRKSRRSKQNKFALPREPPNILQLPVSALSNNDSSDPSKWTRSSLGLWMRPAPSIRSNVASARAAENSAASANSNNSVCRNSKDTQSARSAVEHSDMRVQLSGEMASRIVAWVRNDTDDGIWERNYWTLTSESLCRYDDDITRGPRQQINIRDIIEVSKAKDNRSPENSFEPIGPADIRSWMGCAPDVLTFNKCNGLSGGTVLLCSLKWLRGLQQHPHMRPNPVHGPKVVLMQGALNKMGKLGNPNTHAQLNRQWKRRLCKLFSNGELQYFVSMGGRKKGTIRLNAVLDVLCCPGVERSSGKVRAAFDLITVDRRWQFEATTREEMVQWVSILRYFKPVRKELVIRSPSYR